MSIKLGILASSRQQSATLLLDLYPNAAAAYSLRRLRTLYTGSAIRVSRDFDSAQTDIGFNPDGSLNTTALSAFVLGSNGRIVTWYDQSGNGRNAFGNLTNSPFIVLNGTIYTLNGKPSIFWLNAQNQRLLTSTFSAAIPQPISSYSVTQLVGLSGQNASIIYDSNDTTGNNGFILGHGGVTEPPPLNLALFISTPLNVVIEPSNNNTELVSVLYNTTNTNVYVNAVQKVTNQNTGSNSLVGLTIGNIRYSIYYNIYDFSGYISELVFYPSLQTGNNTGIQNNINSFYTIY